MLNSVMNKSNTGGPGEGSDESTLIGDIIMHGKRKYWLKGSSYHYHCTLQAGENTLEAQLTRLLVRTMSEPDFSYDKFQEAYIKFMTTEGSHNDAYAASAHRAFFKNYAIDKKDPKDCADNDGVHMDGNDALTFTVPVILKHSDLPKDQLYKEVHKTINVCRKTTLEPYALAWTDILVDVLHG